MILALLRVMFLGLLRDRGALILAFALPPAIFLIFASIFAAATSERLELKVAIARLQASPAALRLDDALRKEDALRVLQPTYASRDEVARDVASGAADVGLVIGGDPRDGSHAAISVLVEPSKLMAGAMMAGQVQQVVARRLPDIVLARTAPGVEAAVGGFSPEQSARLAAAIDRLSQADRAGAQQESTAGESTPEESTKTENTPGESMPGFVETQTIGAVKASSATITYYAGAVAILFLLFSALQSAATLIDDRNSGILDRIAVGPAGTDVVVLGKWIFLTLQGILQVSLIFAIAALVYDITILPRFGSWLLATVAAALAAAGLALVTATACTSRQQAQTVSTFVVLICSAVGGSMVPRFMMPGWLQFAGRFTPNTWAIEAYYGVLWRDEALSNVLPEIICLLATGFLGAGLAIVISRSRLKF
ncbi:ABC transporter permease [Rhizobium sp. SSA_523]|uniref:ABC transporter permease n=1 Tax=Rhizobium sp. SSA_523 TaxID=2952477 RepID=UPI00209134DF|nr:ABC transporter permease [Rhizobium sp. SSA_523]MCO5734748.1 ABC transporter permease [Rhizobium sp. SSA_523]WKC22987.1 ABC transporter permease [Rhizobium sp. SSA_523]